MTVGLFALGGVVLGGLLNGFVSFVLDRHTRRVDARVAAQLVLEELALSLQPLAWAVSEGRGDFLNTSAEFGRRGDWDESRITLGYALPPHGHVTIASAHREIERLKAKSPGMVGVVDAADRPTIRGAEILTLRGTAYLRAVVYRPPAWRLQTRRNFVRKSQAEIKALVEKFGKNAGTSGTSNDPDL